MPKRYHISEEEAKEIQKIRKQNKDKTIDKWLEVLLLQAEGKSRAEISSKTGFAKQYITELVGEYRKGGLEKYAQKQYQGNRRNLSFNEEAAILEPFKKAAKLGQIVEISAIEQAYEAAIGHSLEKSSGQIYRVLKRHSWRKVMPRSKHPNKASDEVIEASKKLKQQSKRNYIM